MINLRFHIVSIVAVFLALAVGIFAGSTLLDRATVKLVQSNQASLDAKNKALRSENDAMRALLDNVDARSREFGDSALDPLVGRQLRNDPVLLIAWRGIDEGGISTMVATLHNAGATTLGVLWLDQRTDPASSDDNAKKIGSYLGLGTLDLSATHHADSIRRVADRLVDALSAPLVRAAAQAADPAVVTTTTGSAGATGASTDLLRSLADAQLVDWDPAGATSAPPDLPESGLRVVVVSGEGAQVPPTRLAIPLVKALAAKTKGIVLGELDHSRTSIEVIESKFHRGAVVDPIRKDDAAAAATVTIDNLDEPFGRLAMVLALADIDQDPSGAYGETSTAERQFPGGS